ncbi:Zinc metalloproteinase nas-15 [Eumeta japonica]|uniref:Metalloendopeptidase n=1 Tax=Eumeta variegata TaxID=151549 RepID=A0A4C1TC31_EUMVA|nr:Zinc metalloproteinase nas-15 [Eumeta japonica]
MMGSKIYDGTSVGPVSKMKESIQCSNGFDHDDDGDDEATDHAWEDSGRFEGDMILNKRQRKVIVEDIAEGLSRNGLRDTTKRWPNNEVIYYIQREHFMFRFCVSTGPGFMYRKPPGLCVEGSHLYAPKDRGSVSKGSRSMYPKILALCTRRPLHNKSVILDGEDQLSAIKEGIDDIARSSCIRFRPYRKGDRDAVVVQGNRRGCFSQVGYQGGYQVLNLSRRHPVSRGCFRHGTIVHEFLHALGFYHMQSSPDRDDYVDIKWENIVEPARHNFRKYNSFAVSDFGVGYDYDSVLHYSRRAFSSNGQDTIVPKESGASIGQRTGMSQKDSDKLNKMYCDAGSDSTADEEATTKRPNKRKNKPFQGRGLGYHQGKAVIIELPAAKTVQLSYSPMYPIFDDFSQPPQALSPTQFKGFRELLSIPEYIPIYVSDSNLYKINDSPKPFGQDMKFKEKFLKNDSTRVSEELQGKEKLNLKPENNSNIKTVKENKSQNVGQYDDALDEAFKRLEKIIHTHVYPSQPTHLKPYIERIKEENHTPERREHFSDIDKQRNVNEHHETHDSYNPDPNRSSVNSLSKNPIDLHNDNNSKSLIKNETETAKIERISYTKEMEEEETDAPEIEDVSSNFNNEKSNEVESVFDDSTASQYEADFDKRLASILDGYATF